MNIVVSSAMDNISNIPDSFDILKNISQSILPLDININENFEAAPDTVQSYFLRKLEGGYVELIPYNSEDVNQISTVKEYELPQILAPNNSPVAHQNSPQTEENNSSCEKSIEVSLLKSNQKEPVLHVTPPDTSTIQKTKTALNRPYPLVPRPEKPLINKTVFSCMKCKFDFNSIVTFRKHLKWHKTSTQFNCTKCSSGFNVENNLKIHMVTSHPGQSDVCPICKMKFQRKASLKSHIAIHQVEEYFTCEECNREFQSDDELLRHIEVHAISKATKLNADLLVCPYCKLDFETLPEYKQHVARHVEIKKKVLKGKKSRKRKKEGKKSASHKCKFCGKVFSKSGLLARHERIHTGEKPFVCQFCKQAFAQKGTMLIHMGRHTGVKPYSCTLCPAKFNQKGNLRAHIDKTHTAPRGTRMYKCTQCACIFRKIATLNGHVTRVHINQKYNKTSECDNVIDQVMKGLKILQGAGESEQPQSNQSVPAASEGNTSGSGLVKLSERHVNGSIRRYLVRQKKIDDVRWYFCNYCPNRFKKPSDLIRHFRTHTMEKPFKCTKCMASFSLKSTLMNHYKTHTVKGYQCTYCDTIFKNSRCLNAHIRRHQKNKAPNYICTLCEQTFSTLEEGKKHRSSHEAELSGTETIIEPILKQPLFQTTYGSLTLKPPKAKIPNTGAESPLERPHQCKICDARFTRLISLRRHMQHHTGDRKFKCTICPKSFIAKHRLTEHMNYHKNIKNYSCQVCDKRFVTGSLLKRHTIVHNDHKPYTCPYCDKSFKTLLLCRSHIKGVHKLDATEVKKGNIQKPSTQEPTTQVYIRHDQNPVYVSLDSQNNQPITNQDSPVVCVNISDVRLSGSENANELFSMLKLGNDTLLYTSSNEEVTIFTEDNNKSDMVDPNDVIKRNTSPPDENKISPKRQKQLVVHKSDEETRNLATQPEEVGGKSGNVGSSELGVSMEEFSTLDLAELPINIIEAEGPPMTSLVNTDLSINATDMFLGAQVICVNCHNFFSDMNVFQKHLCSKTVENAQDMNLVLEKQILVNCSGADSGHDKRVEGDDRVRMEGSIDQSEDLLKFLEVDDKRRTKTGRNVKLTQEKIKKFKGNIVEAVDKMEKSKVYRCSSCNYFSSFEDKYRRHIMLIHEDALGKVCKFCFKEFKKCSDLKRHLRTHTGERPFACDMCDKKFSLKSTLEGHKKTHLNGVPRTVRCDVCDALFSTKSSLKVHMLLHTGSRPHACTFCNQTFRTSAIRSSHEKNIHLRSKPAQNNKAKPSATKALQMLAEEVGNSVGEKDQYAYVGESKKDLRIEDPKNLSEQPLITLTASDQQSVSIDPVVLLQHIQNSGIIVTSDSESGIPINLNDITLLDENDIRWPLEGNVSLELCQVPAENQEPGLQAVTNTPQYTLIDVPSEQIIQQSCSNPQNEQSSFNKRPKKRGEKVECELCHKIYANRDVLRKHKRNVHGQNRKFPCIKCDRGYDVLEELNKHIVKAHTGTRPYKCDYCSNSFGEETGLKTHIKRIHQQSILTDETNNALLGLEFDSPMLMMDKNLI